MIILKIYLLSKKIKVSEEFEIPNYEEYDKIIKLNFNVSQLKSISRFYKQKGIW